MNLSYIISDGAYLNVTLAGLNGSLMIVAVIALFVPAMFFNTHSITEQDTNVLSLIVAGLLIVSYIAPVMTSASYFMGNTMDIVFTTIEIVAIAVAVFIAKSITPGRLNQLV